MKKGLRHGYRRVSAFAATRDSDAGGPRGTSLPNLLGYHIDMRSNACLSFMMFFVTTVT